MKHGSLFSGIGGFDLAASWMGWENIFQVEIDPFCTKILEKHFPQTERYKDIYDFEGTKYKGSIDIISGGFPCQPFSQAGKRKGTNDDRYLWPQMLRVISEVQPAFVVGENVAGLLSMENGRTFERILTDLENEGFRIETFVIPACAVGAWHRRDRIWIVANPTEQGLQGCRHESGKSTIQSKNRTEQFCKDVPDTNSKRQSRQGKLEYPGNSKKDKERETNKSIYDCGKSIRSVEPGLDGVVHGIPCWLYEPYGVPRVAKGIKDRVSRLKALGNAIVPQVAYEIFKAIEQTF